MKPRTGIYLRPFTPYRSLQRPVIRLSALFLFLLGTLIHPASAEEIKPLGPLTAKAVSELKNSKASSVTDGISSDDSRWLGGPDADGKIRLELQLPSIQTIGAAHIYSGYRNESAFKDFYLEHKNPSGDWTLIQGTEIFGNKETALAVPFDPGEAIVTDSIRLVVTQTPDKIARIREITLWPLGKELPELGTGVKMPKAPKPIVHSKDGDIPRIYLNQSGFNFGELKRFTAPTLDDGTAFQIKPAKGGNALYTGTIEGHIGDFTAFNPASSGEFVVTAGSETSVPFTIGLWQFERISYPAAIDFMVDTRHYVGNYKRRCRGSFGWRDDHHFSWTLYTLVPQYLSNPAAYEHLPQQITYDEPKPGLWGALEPYDESAPDIVKMIHWGADVILTQDVKHECMKSDLAFFLYAWPTMKQWLPQQNYDAVRQFVEAKWGQSDIDIKYPYDASSDHNLFALKTVVGSTKGELPPGFSVLPNLLMHEVAVRDGLPNADKYLEAAFAQTRWIIDELDWEAPQTTKGQRMSEHVTITGLAACLQLHPGKAPDGLREKINEWARIMVRRSENMWDFRKYTDDGDWTPMDYSHRHKWNEPGNVVGFPAIALAASTYVTAPEVRERLHELAWSHLDNCFGRNPTGRHFSYDAPREVEGVEHGWYTFYRGGIGQLEEARFVLDGSPKTFHYPYHPEVGNKGYTEGWVAFNTAFNLSLAYMARAETELKLIQEGDSILVGLRAPVNFDISKEEPITLTLKGPKAAMVTLVEKDPDSDIHVGRIRLSDLGAQPGDRIHCSYGYGYMGSHAELEVTP
ncbi:hypothetical protein [Coraliomargarita sinensis]|nr:hypothetical protein [Coraliomargarita sinensis]